MDNYSFERWRSLLWLYKTISPCEYGCYLATRHNTLKSKKRKKK